MDRHRSRLSRREFVVGAGSVGLVAGCGRLPWQAPPAARVDRVGILVARTSDDARFQRLMEAFEQELRDRGYVEGQNIALEWRFAEGRDERLPALAHELASLPVQILVASDSPGIRAAKAATSSIPIVMGVSGDPVAQGFVDSLARPGGNVTGVTNISRRLASKRLEYLSETLPLATRIAIIWNPSNPAKPIEFAELQDAAQLLRVGLQSLEVREPNDFDGAFEAISREHSEAILTLGDPLTNTHLSRIVAFAAASRLPAMYETQTATLAGGLMSYGPNELQRWRRAAYYVDRILKGAKPADLPVEQPMTFDFVVNLKTAQALGITFPNEIMLQVTEVIQ
jgi:putative ABC transport system substrate-binding protein